MKYYYGLVDTKNIGYGFVEEGDSRITDDFIELTEEQWSNLLDEQSEGKEIVCYQNKVFTTTDKYRYFVDDNGHWQKRDNNAVETIVYTTNKANFEQKFFKLDGYGWYRKQPKGFSSALESISAVSNALALGASIVPAETFTFYEEPNFKDSEQCTEAWLVEHQIKSPQMSKEEFGQFYMAFIDVWNKTEHK